MNFIDGSFLFTKCFIIAEQKPSGSGINERLKPNNHTHCPFIKLQKQSQLVGPFRGDGGHGCDVVGPLPQVGPEPQVVLAAQDVAGRRRAQQRPHHFKFGILGLLGLARGAVHDELHEAGSVDHQPLAPGLRCDGLGFENI